jgi:hypothetical protein
MVDFSFFLGDFDHFGSSIFRSVLHECLLVRLCYAPPALRLPFFMAVTPVYYVGILPKMALAVCPFFSYGGFVRWVLLFAPLPLLFFACYVWNLCSFCGIDVTFCASGVYLHIFFLSFPCSLFFP